MDTDETIKIKIEKNPVFIFLMEVFEYDAIYFYRYCLNPEVCII